MDKPLFHANIRSQNLFCDLNGDFDGSKCRIGFFMTDNCNSDISDTCMAQATCGDKDQSGNANAVTDADCGTWV